MIKFGNDIVTVGGDWLKISATDPYNPLNLPPNTVRVRTSDGNAPDPTTYGYSIEYDTCTQVEGTTDVYDVYKSGSNFSKLLRGCINVVEVLGANTTGITNMSFMFQNCTALITVALFDTSNVTTTEYMFHRCLALTSVPLFDTSKATNMQFMFTLCSALTTVPLFNTSNAENTSSMFSTASSLVSVPLFNTSKVKDMSYMFGNCFAVESGALALYQQASSQANPPTTHQYTFKDCGKDTTTGAAELAQIPSDWKEYIP